MLSFTADLLGVESLLASSEDALRALGAGIHRAVVDSTDEGAAEARSHIRSRTGRLADNTTARMFVVGPDRADGAIEADTPYARYVEEGTRPHDIWPKAGEGTMGPLRRGQSRRDPTDIGTHRVALRWFDGAGGVHFARMVHHPGSRSYPFMGPGYLKAERVLHLRTEEAVAAFLARMAG